MPSHIIPDFSDPALLLAAQAGYKPAGDDLCHRSTNLIVGMIYAARPRARQEFYDDVRSEVMRMIFDPNVIRFQSARGNTKQYLFGLVKNAIRIIENQRKPVCVNREIKPLGNGVNVSRRDAGCLYHNTMQSKPVPVIETQFIDRELVDFVLAPEDPLTRTAVQMHFMEDIPVITVAKSLKVDRFALARLLKRFCENAYQRLAMSGVT